jgi:hypothetical protein
MCLLIDISIPCYENVLKKEASTGIRRSTDRGAARLKRGSEADTSTNRCDWELIKIISDVFRRHPRLTVHRIAENGHAWNNTRLDEECQSSS